MALTEYQQKYITDKSTCMYINEIAEALNLTYAIVHNYIKRKRLKQKKVQTRKNKSVKKAKVITGIFNVNAKSNWAI